MRRIGGGVLALAVLGGLLASCGDDDGGSAQPDENDGGGGETTVPAEIQTGGRLVMAIVGETDGWTPANNRFTSSGLTVARAVYDPLAAFDAEGVAQPYLAESIEPNDEFTEWTITLRDGVTFHNGDPLTADAVVQNLEAVLASPLLGPSMKYVEGIEETGSLEVQVTMNQPWSTFPVLIAQQPGFIAHPSMLTAENPDPIGTGPFVFDEWIPDDRFTANRNPDYWRSDAAGTQLPYLDGVEFRVIADPTSRRQALDAGDIDLLQTNDSATLIELGTDLDPPDGQEVVYTAGSDDEMMIALNAQSGVTDNPKLRRALALGTDRELLNDSLYDGRFQIADTPYAPDSPWYSDPGWPEYDPDEASRLVEEVRASGDSAEVALSVGTAQDQLALGQAIAEQWNSIGVETQIKATETTQLTLDIVTGQYEATVISLFNAPDPDGDYHFWDTTNIAEPGEFSLAFTRYQNETMAEALAAARATTDEAERQAEYATVWSEVANNFPMIWLWHTQYVILEREQVNGVDTFVLPSGDPAQIVNWGSVFLTEAWLQD
jgi:ABC-type transport system substrate-binding protein